jgi:hypothetical protein
MIDYFERIPCTHFDQQDIFSRARPPPPISYQPSPPMFLKTGFYSFFRFPSSSNSSHIFRKSS